MYNIHYLYIYIYYRERERVRQALGEGASSALGVQVGQAVASWELTDS